MKIFLVTETLFEGGAEIFVLRLARALRNKGVDAEVLLLNKRYENKAFVNEFRDVPIRRLHLAGLGLFGWFDKALFRLGWDFSIKYFFQSRQLRRALASADIIHSHTIQVDHLLSKLKESLGARLVVTIHGDYSAHYESFQKGELRLWMNLDKKLKELAAAVDGWVVISQEQLQFMHKVMNVPGERIRMIYNGYEPLTGITAAGGRTGKEFTVGMVSRGHAMKGWEILIRAFIQLPADARLILVGGGEYMEKLQQKYGDDKRIHFTGFQESPGRWLEQMDLFVLPTRFPFESLPAVVAEALSHGIPVLATNVGEIGRMITNEQTGMQAGELIEAGDPESMQRTVSDRLAHFYLNRDKLASMQAAATGAADKFSMEKCVAAYIQLYQQVAGTSAITSNTDPVK